MIRLLAPWRDSDPDTLARQFPTILAVNEVDVAADAVDGTSPEGRWLAGYWNDDAPTADEWVQAVAAAPEPQPVEVATTASVTDAALAALAAGENPADVVKAVLAALG